MIRLSSLIILYLLLKHKINSYNLNTIGEDSIIFKGESKGIISYKTNENQDIFETLNPNNSNPKRRLDASKKNLIIGAVINYDWHSVRPFFKSFEAVGFENCDCVIFVGRISQNTINKIESCGVITQNIPSEYFKMNSNKMRFKVYLDYLNDNLDKYNLILHVDTRDVVFQQDIFQLYGRKEPFLGLALEDGFMNEVVNRGWFKYAFGEDIYKEVENERVICSGTIWGTADKFFNLINQIWEILKRGPSNLNLHDQSALNYIIYHKKTYDDCLIKTETKDGYILTLGLAINKSFSFDSENNVLNEKGDIVALVHQYDRKIEIATKLRKKYSYEGKLNITKIIIKNYSFEGELNITNKTFIRKDNNLNKKPNIVPIIIFLIFIINFIIIVVFFIFNPKFLQKMRISGYKKYKYKKSKKVKKFNVSKYKFFN